MRTNCAHGAQGDLAGGGEPAGRACRGGDVGQAAGVGAGTVTVGVSADMGCVSGSGRVEGQAASAEVSVGVGVAAVHGLDR